MSDEQRFLTSTESALTRGERRDAAENRSRILEVARKLFKEWGVEAVSMHQIAKAAGVGQGTLYRRYAEKADLCADLIKETAEEALFDMNSWITESLGTGSSLDVLECMIKRVIEFTDSRVHLLAACNTYMDKTSTHSENTIYHRLHETVSRLIAKIVEERNTLSVDVTMTSDLLIAALNPRLLMFEREVRGYTKEQILEGIRRIYIAGLFREEP